MPKIEEQLSRPSELPHPTVNMRNLEKKNENRRVATKLPELVQVLPGQTRAGTCTEPQRTDEYIESLVV